jgi:pilus assembly protein CpaE
MSMSPLTAALFISNRTLWEPAHNCIQNLPVRVALEQSDPGNLEALLDRLELHRVDVILLEVSQLAAPLEEFTRRLRETSSQPAVFVLHPEASPKHIMEAIHAGAAEFLFPPLAETLRQAFERLSANRARASAAKAAGLGRTFGFISAKGGCGATTFAAHTAVNVARITQQQVLAGDFDFEAGLFRFLFKARNTYSVRDALDNMHRMDASYWKALIGNYGTLVDVLPSPEEIASKRQSNTQETASLLRFVRSNYTVSVFDFGRYYSPSALDALPELETLYLLTTMDLEALEQARACLDAIATREYSSRVRILLNRSGQRTAPDVPAVETLLGTQVAGVFSDDPDALYEAWSEGTFLTAKTKLGRELNALAKTLAAPPEQDQEKDKQKQQSSTKAPAGRRWLSFLRGAQA